MKKEIFGLFLMAPMIAIAADAPPPPWEGAAEAGLNIATGNTETEDLNAKMGITHNQGRWHHHVGLDAVNSATNDTTTAARYSAAYKVGYDITDRYYALGSARYDKDRFSGFDHQSSISAGIGWHAFLPEPTKLDLEIGAGVRESELTTGEAETEAIARFSLGFSHQFSDTARFFQDLLIEGGSSNVFIQSGTGIEVKMIDKLALKLGYTVRNNSDPSSGKKDTDTLTSVNLVYSLF
ncbi:MAG TPA: DUF481 domain-containing protein [Gammaproteobacteria bacterium]|jgi:putative salt-induced outer membrane protein|nr:DUF481 domain-containing protein [Gammaproteobacteria bacterium]